MRYIDIEEDEARNTLKAAPALAQHDGALTAKRVLIAEDISASVVALIPHLKVEVIRPQPLIGGHRDPRSHIHQHFVTDAPWRHSRRSGR